VKEQETRRRKGGGDRIDRAKKRGKRGKGTRREKETRKGSRGGKEQAVGVGGEIDSLQLSPLIGGGETAQQS
jgi:hypothetical protein